MFMDSRHQGIMGMAYLCSLMCGDSARKTQMAGKLGLEEPLHDGFFIHTSDILVWVAKRLGVHRTVSQSAYNVLINMGTKRETFDLAM